MIRDKKPRLMQNMRSTSNLGPIAETKTSCVLVQELSQLVEERFDEDFHREYPQLAVAMGGAMPSRLDEGRPLHTFPGDTPQFTGLTDSNPWV